MSQQGDITNQSTIPREHLEYDHNMFNFKQEKSPKSQRQLQNPQLQQQTIRFQRQQRPQKQQEAYPIDDCDGDMSRVCNQSLESRNGFIRKVYTLLFLELAFTLGSIALGLYTSMQYIYVSYRRNQYNQDQFDYFSITWWFWTTMILPIFLHLILYFFPQIFRKVPVNYFILAFYVFCYSQLLTGVSVMFSLFYPTLFVWLAWLIVIAMVISLTVFACLTSTDFTTQIGLLVIFLVCLITSGIFAGIFYSYAGSIFYTAFVILCYGLLMIWETQLIMGNGRIKLSIDEYILASLMLYGVIVQMFMRVIDIPMFRLGRR